MFRGEYGLGEEAQLGVVTLGWAALGAGTVLLWCHCLILGLQYWNRGSYTTSCICIVVHLLKTRR